MSKKVLIFTYYWPPAGGVAVQRFLKFSKFLPEFGWEPVVVTVQNGSYPFYDDTLEKQVPPSVKVYRTPTFEPFEFYNLLRGKKGKNMPTVSVGGSGSKTLFQKLTEYVRANYFVPDARVGWVKYAVKQANEIIAQERIDAIVTTSTPHSAHLIGLELKKRHELKWIADFRDPWTKNLMNEFLPRTSSTMRKDEQYENDVLKNADAITVISGGMSKDFESRAKRVEVIYNGFDEDDFSVTPLTTPGKFTMRHVGNMLISMNVPELWQAIGELRNENENFRKDFLLEVVGNAHPLPRSEFAKYGFEDCVKYLGYVTHDKAIGYIKGADCLLFLVSNVPHSDMLTSGKIFEYLASRSLILGLGPIGGNAAQILESCKRDAIIAFEDKATMKDRLLKYYNNWKSTGVKFEHTGNEHLIYSRKAQCGRLSEILNQLTA